MLEQDWRGRKFLGRDVTELLSPFTPDDDTNPHES